MTSELSDHLQRFLGRAADLLCVACQHGDGLLWVNDRWTETLGWSREELLGRDVVELIHPDDVEATAIASEGARRGETVVRFQNRYRKKSGGWVWLEWSATPDGDVLHCIARDVTSERTRQLERVKELRMWDLAANLANIGYWQVDVESDVMIWSSECYRIHGVDPDTFTPTLSAAVAAYHPDDRHVVKALGRRAGSTGEPFRFNLRIVRPDGEIRHVESHGMAHLGPDDRVMALFGVFRDITDDPTIIAMNDFAFIVSHDLLEPVRTVRTFTELVLSDDEVVLTDEVRRYLGFIESSGARMADLIDSLRRYTQLAGRVLAMPVEPTRICEEVVADLATHIGEHQAVVEVGGIPRVLCNDVRLRLVFTNLFNNSLRYRSEATPHIQVSGEAVGVNVRIDVTDNGIGIPREFRDRVFRVFQTLHPKDRYGGTGIGLAIVKRIIEQSAGRVWVADAPGGRGTTVSFELPAAP